MKWSRRLAIALEWLTDNLHTLYCVLPGIYCLLKLKATLFQSYTIYSFQLISGVQFWIQVGMSAAGIGLAMP